MFNQHCRCRCFDYLSEVTGIGDLGQVEMGNGPQTGVIGCGKHVGSKYGHAR